MQEQSKLWKIKEAINDNFGKVIGILFFTWPIWAFIIYVINYALTPEEEKEEAKRKYREEEQQEFIEENADRIYDAAIELDYFPEEYAEDFGFIKYSDLIETLEENQEYEALEVIENLYGYME